MARVFLSHTKKDKNFCDAFDRVCARVVGVGSFRSEFETIEVPAWKTIKGKIDASVALFFLVGRKLVESQASNGAEWRYTQNWIAYEIGLACEKPIDVWAICDDVLINFPMPYINNYLTVSLERRPSFEYLRSVLEKYAKGQTFSCPYVNEAGEMFVTTCPWENCGMMFNLHVTIKPWSDTERLPSSKIRCPHCLKDMMFPKGHLM